MASMIELDNTEWALVEDRFDPSGRQGAPAHYPHRQIVANAASAVRSSSAPLAFPELGIGLSRVR